MYSLDIYARPEPKQLVSAQAKVAINVYTKSAKCLPCSARHPGIKKPLAFHMSGLIIKTSGAMA